MSLNAWVETLMTSPVDGTALNTSTTPTSILPAQAKFVFPANYFEIRKALKITAMGRISNIVTSPGTLTLDLRMGSTVVANGGAINLNVVAKTNVSWWLEWYLTCRAVGSGTGTTFMHHALFQSESIIASPANTAGGNGSLNLPVSAPAVGTGVDVGATQIFDLFATFSVSNAANSIQNHSYILTALN